MPSEASCRRVSSYGDEAEAGEVPRNAPNGELDPLISRGSIPDTNTGTSNSTNLLILIGPALVAGIIVKAFDLGFLGTSYSRVASDLGHFKDAPWITLTASISSAVFMPIYSYLLRAFGMQRMMLVAIIVFAIGVALCAISKAFWQLLVSRCVVGAGVSGIVLLSAIVINDIVGIRKLALWESFVTCVEMITGMVAGPLGASMFRRFTWQSVFLLEIALAIVEVAVLYLSFERIKSYPEHSGSVLIRGGDSRIPRMDIGGWLLLILAVTIPFIALTFGDNLISWGHPVEILLLICAPISMVLFVLFEAKVSIEPIINMTPIFNVQYLLVLFQMFGFTSIISSITFIIPPYIQVRAFDGPSFEDWALTCVYLGLLVGAVSGGYMIQVGIAPVQRIMLANAVLLEGFCALFATRVIKPELAPYAPLLVGFGVCAGMLQSCLLSANMLSTQEQWQSQALALYYLVLTFGAALGMTLTSTIIRTVPKPRIRASLGNSEATEKIIADAMQDLKRIRLLDDGPRAQVLAAFEHAMHTSFFLPCALAAVVIVLAAGMNVGLREVAGNESTPRDDREQEAQPEPRRSAETIVED